MFKKKKLQEAEAVVNTEETAPKTEQKPDETEEYKKNIKVLWIYTTLFCVFALALIFVSSFFQQRHNRENEMLRVQVEKHQLEISTGQSTIQNIELEIEKYQQINDILNKRNTYLEEQSKIDKDLLASSSEMVSNADYLLMAKFCLDAGDTAGASTNLAAVDTNYLTSNMRILYDQIVAGLSAQ